MLCGGVSINSEKRLYKGGLWFGIMFILIFILKNPKFASETIYTSLLFCVKVIIPSLFPFIILSNMLIESGFAELTGRILNRPVRFLFNINGNCASVILLGCIAGFPVGAKCAVMLYEKGLCGKVEVERMLPYCNNAGAAFVIGTVGMGVFNNYRTGVVIYVVQIITAVICGVIFSFPRRKIEEYCNTAGTSSVSISESIINAGTSMISICGHICFFSFLLSVIMKFVSNTYAVTFISGLFELTSGVRSVDNIALAGLFCGWSGFAVHAQISSFVTQHGISMKYCIFGKALQGLLMFLILLFSK
jgi:hypothetical protein